MEYIGNSVRKIGSFLSSPSHSTIDEDRIHDLEHEPKDIAQSENILVDYNSEDESDSSCLDYCRLPSLPEHTQKSEAVEMPAQNPELATTKAVTVAGQRTLQPQQKSEDSANPREGLRSQHEELAQQPDPAPKPSSPEASDLESYDLETYYLSDYYSKTYDEEPYDGEPYDEEVYDEEVYDEEVYDEEVYDGKAYGSLPWELLLEEKWALEPNHRARECLQQNGHDAAAMLDELEEPAYACRDIEIRDSMQQMTAQIEDLARLHFSWTSDPTRLQSVLASLPDETVKIIGYTASGGPGGVSRWEDLFITPDKRQALVCATVGNRHNSRP
ncbi:hypothetical protein OPT61_g10705 [Boeremia exigua]|uniref:Uncharacterized protein n=1 Tax=Boeremia exigua TaxID=749465 RepID=A0ACC2HP81_9PLEO|nr:hypothetical protein OPT61_g10705 [Boeremia exigua]